MEGNRIGIKKGIGLYVHIPFCISKCRYCDFNSYPGMEHLIGPYFDTVLAEIGLRAESIGKRGVETIYIGGGTPSLVAPKYMARLLEVVERHFNVAGNAEISMESNPGTLSFENLREYRAMGINRLSIGLQAWQDRLLKMMGRIHDARQFEENLDAAFRAGFENINADLIFGLPGQTFKDWKETLKAVTEPCNRRPGVVGAVSAGLTHISCYSLSIEERTPFGRMVKEGALEMPDEETDRQMYHYAVEKLAAKGYRHYEISNFAAPGFECKHNLIYWKAREYAGFGAGAHSYLDGVRFANTAEIGRYMEAIKQMACGMGYLAGNRPNRAGPEENCAGAGNRAKNAANTDDRGENATSDVSRNGCASCAGSVEIAGQADGPKSAGPAGFKQCVLDGDAHLYQEINNISRREAMSEFMILGLRLIDGVSGGEFEERFGEKLENVYGKELDMLIKRGLVAFDPIEGGKQNGAWRGCDAEGMPGRAAESIPGRMAGSWCGSTGEKHNVFAAGDRRGSAAENRRKGFKRDSPDSRGGRRGRYRLTPLGLDLANQVFLEFI